MKDNYLANFIEGGIYHVYNRTNNKELLFKIDENRLYFLRQYAKYLDPFLDTFCWSLLPNHFHFLIRVKSKESIINYLQNIRRGKLKLAERKFMEGILSMELLIELEWKRFFNSYSMAFNKENSRKGNLFNRPFKRVFINKESHFTQIIIYINANAIKHGICKKMNHYKWSSWHSLISETPTKLCRKEVLDWFGGIDQFKKISLSLSEYYYSSEMGIEDD